MITGIDGVESFLSTVTDGAVRCRFSRGSTVYSQGEPANTVFYIRAGRVKLSVISGAGKEAVVGILGRGEFFGEGCLANQTSRRATALALADSSLVWLDKAMVFRALNEQSVFMTFLVTYLLTRTIRVEEDLVDHLFNPSEKRLARVLLLLADFGPDDGPQKVIPSISQNTLAEMIGTTGSRVSFFMNRFRKLGMVNYNGSITVHISLGEALLDDH